MEIDVGRFRTNERRTGGMGLCISALRVTKLRKARARASYGTTSQKNLQADEKLESLLFDTMNSCKMRGKSQE